jgi:uncharacterized membrane protein YhaH (DUF805 family)
MEWFTKVLRQYADFEGRARRKEYWMFTLINSAIMFAVVIVFVGLGVATQSKVLMYIGAGLITVYGLAVMVPSIAVTTRRLHDTDRSGWWQLLSLLGIIPFIGWIGGIVVLVFCVLEGTPGPNKYGPDPKAVAGQGFAEPGYPGEPGYPAAPGGAFY